MVDESSRSRLIGQAVEMLVNPPMTITATEIRAREDAYWNGPQGQELTNRYNDIFVNPILAPLINRSLEALADAMPPMDDAIIAALAKALGVPDEIMKCRCGRCRGLR